MVSAWWFIAAWFIIFRKKQKADDKRFTYLKLKYGGDNGGLMPGYNTIAQRLELSELTRLKMKLLIKSSYEKEVVRTLDHYLVQCRKDISNIKDIPLPNIRGTISLRRNQKVREVVERAANEEGMDFHIFFVPWRLRYYARLKVRS